MSILGPLLFVLHANDMPNHLSQGTNIALYADDSKLYRAIDSARSAVSFQCDLDSLSNWSLDRGMEFSTTKCKVLHMSKKRSVKNPQQIYHLDGQAWSQQLRPQILVSLCLRTYHGEPILKICA